MPFSPLNSPWAASWGYSFPVTASGIVRAFGTGGCGWRVIRAEAMSQQGVPLGLLSSPFRFNSINYFWSTAFLLGVTTRPELWLLRRVLAVLLVFPCGVLAVVVGPSVALLMILNTESAWPAGGTDF